MMIAIKENAENIESNYKLIFAVLFFVVIVLVVLAVALIGCYWWLTLLKRCNKAQR